jgi:hypothetical protein
MRQNKDSVSGKINKVITKGGEIFAVDYLYIIVLSFDWTKHFFSRVGKIFHFSDWLTCVAKQVFA